MINLLAASKALQVFIPALILLVLAMLFAIELAQKTGANLHIFHLSTREETELLRKVSRGPLEERRITAEVCMPHLTFTSDDYEKLGRYIKCNPAVKGREDRDALFRGLADGTISLIATDHAPHAAAEKEKPYFSCPSGIPRIQAPATTLERT